tara:strand:- start:2062 stop:2487 length:426 start_codon:yes stop_codon:yes gene_type:complete
MFSLGRTSPIKDLLEGNSIAQPNPDIIEIVKRCHTWISPRIIKKNPIKEENIKIIVDKVNKYLLSIESAILPSIQPKMNKGATLKPEFIATNKALSLILNITTALTSTSKNLQKELIPPIDQDSIKPFVPIVVVNVEFFIR